MAQPAVRCPHCGAKGPREHCVTASGNRVAKPHKARLLMQAKVDEYLVKVREVEDTASGTIWPKTEQQAARTSETFEPETAKTTPTLSYRQTQVIQALRHGPLTSTQVADSVSGPRTSVPVVLSELLKMGLVAKHQGQQQWHLTAWGQQAAARGWIKPQPLGPIEAAKRLQPLLDNPAPSTIVRMTHLGPTPYTTENSAKGILTATQESVRSGEQVRVTLMGVGNEERGCTFHHIKVEPLMSVVTHRHIAKGCCCGDRPGMVHEYNDLGFLGFSSYGGESEEDLQARAAASLTRIDRKHGLQSIDNTADVSKGSLVICPRTWVDLKYGKMRCARYESHEGQCWSKVEETRTRPEDAQDAPVSRWEQYADTLEHWGFFRLSDWARRRA